MIDLKKLAKLATITLRAEVDDIPVRGNAMASGDDAADQAVENEILARLDNGDVWAWAHVTVTATFGGSRQGRANLGACSYESEADFRRDPYFTDMVREALEELASNLESTGKAIEAVKAG